MTHHDILNPVSKKLVDLATGYHTGRLTGSNGQRQRFKVPFASTKCGKRLSILWQVHEKVFGSDGQRQRLKVPLASTKCGKRLNSQDAVDGAIQDPQQINFLIHMISHLQQLLEPKLLITLLTPALSVCLEPRTPVGLLKLASVLVNCGDILEQLAANPFSSTIICRWVWQVHEKTFGDPQVLHQIVKVWEVGDSKAITKAIDIVTLLQADYPDDTFRRFSQRSSNSNSAQLPLQLTLGRMVPANVDIATQEILDTAEECDINGQRTLGVLTSLVSLKMVLRKESLPL